jgi:peptide/nickel transport system substrate-binding protein
VLERFDKYYLGTPAIARVVIKPFDALRTTWTSLLRHEVDMVTDVAPHSVEFIRNDDIDVVLWKRWYQYIVAFNSRGGPFSSPVVRRALNTAIDRQALIDQVLSRSATPATSPIWPNFWAYDSSVPPYVFDPGAAAGMLDRAGYPLHRRPATESGPNARFRFTCLIVRDFSVYERIALDLQRQLYDVGVDMQFEAVEPDEYNARIGQGKFEAVLVDMISGPSPGRPYLFWRTPRGTPGLNVFGYDNPEAERLFQSLATSTNEAAIRSITGRLQRTLLEDPPALFLAWNERARAVRRDFRVYQEPGRDPLSTLWRWTPVDTRVPSAQ